MRVGFVSPAGCRRDKDGYYWITGRIDDMLNVSGTNLQTFQQVAAVLLRPVREELLLFILNSVSGYKLRDKCLIGFI